MATGTGRIFDALDIAEQVSPDHCAVEDSGTSLSYAELKRRSLACAVVLADLNVGKGDRIVVQALNSWQYAVLLYGAARAGAVLVPVHPELRPFQLRRILDDAQPALVVADADLRAPLLAAGAPSVVDIDHVWRGRAAPAAPVEVNPADLALLLYTSGTTSAPKGVMSTHANVTFAVAAIAERLEYRPDDKVLLFLPMSFDYGLYQLLLSCHAGATLHLADQRAPARLLHELEVSVATVVPLVPTMADMLVSLSARRPASTRVRLFTNTGAVLPLSAAEGLRNCFPGASVVRMYGITECKRVTIGEPDEDRWEPNSLGRPLPGTEVLIVDDRGRPVQPGATGEIVVRGPHVMAGYWRSPELTQERFRPEPHGAGHRLHTGDFGSLDEQGRLRFEGRRDDIVKRNGIRIGLLEIENAALDISGVRLAAAVVAPASGRLVLLVTGDVTPSSVAAGLAERLDRARLPDRIEVRTSSLPTGPNGKIDRSQIIAQLQAVEEIGDVQHRGTGQQLRNTAVSLRPGGAAGRGG